MDSQEIKRLAALARISVTDAEAEKYAGDAQKILEYVAQINDVAADPVDLVGDSFVENVLREDVITNEPGSKTEQLVSTASQSQDQYVKVKKILGGGSQ